MNFTVKYLFLFFFLVALISCRKFVPSENSNPGNLANYSNNNALSIGDAVSSLPSNPFPKAINDLPYYFNQDGQGKYRGYSSDLKHPYLVDNQRYITSYKECLKQGFQTIRILVNNTGITDIQAVSVAKSLILDAQTAGFKNIIITYHSEYYMGKNHDGPTHAYTYFWQPLLNSLPSTVSISANVLQEWGSIGSSLDGTNYINEYTIAINKLASDPHIRYILMDAPNYGTDDAGIIKYGTKILSEYSKGGIYASKGYLNRLFFSFHSMDFNHPAFTNVSLNKDPFFNTTNLQNLIKNTSLTGHLVIGQIGTTYTGRILKADAYTYGNPKSFNNLTALSTVVNLAKANNISIIGYSWSGDGSLQIGYKGGDTNMNGYHPTFTSKYSNTKIYLPYLQEATY